MRKFLLAFMMLLMLPAVLGVDGATIISNSTQTKTPDPASSIATLGGSFTTMTLNVSSQTLRWKAYVGNVTGLITLDDGSNKTIYDWSLSTVAGEVYASRNSTITWSTIICANTTTINAEQLYLNTPENASDRLNRTFNRSIHRTFYVGTTHVVNSTCPAVATYVNDTAQAASENANFQEVLLYSTNLIYTALLEPGSQGFNNQQYNFQMIVPEDATTGVPTPYYFYAELT